MAKMHQADEFDFEFEIETENGAVNPDNITTIRVELGGIVDSYPTGEIYFKDGKWYFPIKAEHSNKLRGKVKMQAELESGSQSLHTDIEWVDVLESLPGLRGGRNG